MQTAMNDVRSTLKQQILCNALQPDISGFLTLIDLDLKEEQLSYHELIEEAKLWSAFYSSKGLTANDNIIIILPQSRHQYCAYLGAILGEQIPAMFAFPSSKFSEEEYFKTIGALLDNTSPRYIVTYPELKDHLAPFAGEIPIGTPDDVPRHNLGPISSTDSKMAGDIAFLQYSSGTTGLKKGVAISSRAILWQISAYADAIKLTPADKIVSWLPLYHDMGLIACFFLPMLTRTPLIAMSPHDWVKKPELMLHAITRHKASLCWLPNFAFNFMATRIADEKMKGFDLSSLRAAINCAEPIQRESQEAFTARFSSQGFSDASHATCYAMAENTFAITSGVGGLVVEHLDAKLFLGENRAVLADTESTQVKRVVSSGSALPDTEILIVDGNRVPLPERVVGEIAVKSPCLLSQYYKNPEATAASISEGWYYTGDLGYLAGRELFVTGRAKDTIIVNGKNIYPQDVEEILNGVAGLTVGRNVVFGIFNEDAGTEEIIVLAESEAASCEDAGNLERVIYRKVAAVTEIVPSDVRILPPRWLIKSSAGKISRTGNRNKYLEIFRADTTSASAVVSDELLSETELLVHQCLMTVVEKKHHGRSYVISADTSILKSGILDSLSLVELIISIERASKRQFPPEFISQLEKWDTVRQIARFLETLQNYSGAGTLLDYLNDLDERQLKCSFIEKTQTSFDLLILGTSRMLGLSTSVAAQCGYQAFNFSVNNAQTDDWYAMVRFYLDQNRPGLRYVILGMDISSFCGSREYRLMECASLSKYIDPDAALQNKTSFESSKRDHEIQHFIARGGVQLSNYSYDPATGDMAIRGNEQFNQRKPTILHEKDNRNTSESMRFNGVDCLNDASKRNFELFHSLCRENNLLIYAFVTPIHRHLLEFLEKNTAYRQLRAELNGFLEKLAGPWFIHDDLTDVCTFGGLEDDYNDATHIGAVNSDILLRYALEKIAQHQISAKEGADNFPIEATKVNMNASTLNAKKTRLSDFVPDNGGVYKSPENLRDFCYSDGAEREDRILNTLNSVRDLSTFSEELRSNIHDWVSEYHFSQERHNLLRHLHLSPGMTILELGCGCGSITRQLGESGAAVTAVEGSLQRARSAAARCRDLPNVRVHCSNFQDVEFTEKYDVVTFIGVLEYSPQYFESEDPIRECLEIACNALKPDGVLIIAIENQLGLKYFCGYREDHADIAYFSIEDRYNSQTAVTFGRRELKGILKTMGLSQVEFHYPFPDYKVPKAVFTERAFQEKGFHPAEIIRRMNSRDYAGELTPAFDEQLSVPVLCRNGVMEDFSNSFLVLASRESIRSAFRDPKMLAAVYTTERANPYNVQTVFVGRENAIIARKSRLVRGASPVSAADVLTHLPKDEQYIAGQNLEAEYRRCVALKDFATMSRLLTLQLQFLAHEATASHLEHNPAAALIRPEYFDCVPSNLVLRNGQLHYIDREWTANRSISLGSLLLRTVEVLHCLDKNMPDLSKENLIRILNQAGFRIDADTIREYDRLTDAVMAQVYHGANLGTASSTEDKSVIRINLKTMLSKLQYLPKPESVLNRLRSHLEQMILIRDGHASENYLNGILSLGPASNDEIELCGSILEMIGDDPEWHPVSDFITKLIKSIDSILNSNQTTGSTDENDNPLEPHRQFEYGNEFENFICPNPFLYMELGQAGDVSSCCYLPFSLGNIRKEYLADLWNSPSAKELRRSILSGEYCYCDKRKCAAMQEASLPTRDTYQYQLPYRLIRKDATENETLRSSISTGRGDTSSSPEIISFEDDPSCNLSCPSCRTSAHGLGPEQSREIFQRDSRLIDALGEDIRELWFCGAGDPIASSAYRNLLQQYDFEKFPQIRFRLDTNAMLLDEAAWGTILDRIKERITLVAVSVDAATDATYAAIRRGGNFQTLLTNLQFIAALPERKKGLGFIIRMIVQQKNFREMRQFVELGSRLGVDGVVFSVMQNWGSFTEEQYLQQAVHLPGHPDHGEFRSMLQDPKFDDPLVDMGNLTLLFHQQPQRTKEPKAGIKVTEPSVATGATAVARARAIAFYLPQFHPIPENDLWWGKGFTEWTNVTKAKPLFEGHYQPHLPADLGFYDLRVGESREHQAELARDYGIEAFCYWHYWFAGKRLIERPFEEMVRSGKPDFPFCLGWANQTWSGIWHGAPNRILIEQSYPGLEDYRAHFEALLPAFRDPRYLRVQGKPLFVIYSPQNLPDARLFTSYWQELAQGAGLTGFHFVAHNVRDPESYGCQACVDNAPFVSMDAPLLPVRPLEGERPPKVCSYEDLVRYLADYPLAQFEYPLVVPNWDNTPRSGANGFVLQGSTPALFQRMMEDAVAKLARRSAPERIVFIKAWNEWAEGNHLEPDRLYGHRYLEAVRDCLWQHPAGARP